MVFFSDDLSHLIHLRNSKTESLYCQIHFLTIQLTRSVCKVKLATDDMLVGGHDKSHDNDFMRDIHLT